MRTSSKKQKIKNKKLQLVRRLLRDFPSYNPSRHRISGISRTPRHWCLTHVNKTWCCVLFINSLFDVSQRALRVVEEIIEGFASEQPRSLPPRHHHQTHLAIWRCSPLFAWGKGVCVCVCGVQGGCASRKDFSLFSFNINHSYWEMLPHVHKTPQPLPVMGYTLLPSCFCLCLACATVSVSFGVQGLKWSW